MPRSCTLLPLAVAALFPQTFPASPADTVALRANVLPFLSAEVLAQTMDVGIFADGARPSPLQGATFRVTANVAYTISARFEVWPAPPAGGAHTGPNRGW